MEVKSYRTGVIVVFAVVAFISYLHSSFADIITLKEGGETQGQEIKGQIIEDEETDEGVKIRIREGQVIFIKKEVIAKIEKKEITDDLVLTKDGVEDQWGTLIPPLPFEMLTLSQFTEQGGHFYSLAQKYEAKARGERKPELRQAGLMAAVVYYTAASNSPEEEIRKSGRSGVERCSAQLFNTRKEDIAIPFGPSMTEHIRFFVQKLNDEKEKGKYADIYFAVGQDYDTKANVKELPAEERLKNLQIAMNCYQIAFDYSPGEETRIKASEALLKTQQKIQDVYQSLEKTPH